MEKSYEGGEMIQRLIYECVIRGQYSEVIEYKNGIVYRNGRIYIGANKNVRQKIISEIHVSQ